MEMTQPGLMTIKQLQGLSEVLKIAVLAKHAGINTQTLWGKLRRGSELTVVESDVIERVLKERYGLHFERDKTLEIE